MYVRAAVTLVVNSELVVTVTQVTNRRRRTWSWLAVMKDDDDDDKTTKGNRFMIQDLLYVCRDGCVCSFPFQQQDWYT